MILDYFLPDMVKMLLLLKNTDATEEDFQKLHKASKYQYEEMFAEKWYGITEDFYCKINLTEE